MKYRKIARALGNAATKIHNPFPMQPREVVIVRNAPARKARVVGIVNVPKSVADIRQASKISTVSRRSEMWG